MSTPADLEQALADYLQVRRASGAGLARAEKLLRQYLSHLSEHGTDRITVADAAAWATLPAAADPRWWAYRLSVARGFAAWLHTFDESVQVPPAGLIRSGPRRSTPYLYSDDEIVALLDAAGRLRHPLKSATYQTLLGLLAVTGMRVGEAIGLDRADFDAAQGLLTVRAGKFGKARLLPLQPSTVTAVNGYLRDRDRLCPVVARDALLVSVYGNRLRYNTVWRVVHKLLTDAGLTAGSPSRQRIHDLRHSFAVATLSDWYAHGADVAELLPRLSTYLGHTDPAHTYWYLSAAPQLLTPAVRRLDTPQRGRR